MKTTIRQSIVTKYVGPTNFRGTRVKASCDRGHITVSWDSGQNYDENHHYAMAALLAKFAKEDGKPDNGWGDASQWFGAALPNNNGIAWVQVAGFGLVLGALEGVMKARDNHRWTLNADEPQVFTAARYALAVAKEEASA